MKGLENDNSELVIQCESQQLKIKEMVDMYDNFENKSERFIQKNKAMTDTLLSLISLHNDWNNQQYHHEDEYPTEV
jgi:hypothetical protein